MASASTLNQWADELARSILGSGNQTLTRRVREIFTKRIRHHNYARTNQFEVADRLDGLEEKFQILNFDDLSDQLRDKRVQLREFDDRWIPDVLDLLLRLAGDPTTRDDQSELIVDRKELATPPPLRWAEVELEDPIDRDDPIWRDHSYSDYSSDEEEAFPSSTASSPASAKKGDHIVADDEAVRSQQTLFENLSVDHSLLKQFTQASSMSRISGGGGSTTVSATQPRLPGELTDVQLAREFLFAFQGLPSILYIQDVTGYYPDESIAVIYRHGESIQAILSSACGTIAKVNLVRKWSLIPQASGYTQLLQNEVLHLLARFDASLSSTETAMLQDPSGFGPVTISGVMQSIHDFATPILAISHFLQRLDNVDAVGTLDVLFDEITRMEARYDEPALLTLLPIFLMVFEYYFKPVQEWLVNGRVDENLEHFFISEKVDKRKRNDMWHDWYNIVDTGSVRPPQFLKTMVPRMLEVGKMASFLRMLNVEPIDVSMHLQRLHRSWSASSSQDEAINFALFTVVFGSELQEFVEMICRLRANQLRSILSNQCGLSQTLDAVSFLYLGQDGVVMDKIESRIFHQIDRCQETWNDRFLIADHLEDVFHEINTIDSRRLIIHSAYTSSRTMQDRRRSVKILSALAVDYVLDWPIANILRPESMTRYRRIALMLSQIRRAKYMLEERCRFFVHKSTLATSRDEQRSLQSLHFALLTVVNILYDHFVGCVIQPMTQRFRSQLSGMIDEMIQSHNSYTETLERACLTGKRLKVLNDTIVAILDLCVKFADLVSTPSLNLRKSSLDFEASSFRSAQSRNRHKRRGGAGNADDADDSEEEKEDDDDKEGYSTFILEEDSSIVKEALMIKTQFLRHGEFLLAGLHGLSRTSDTIGDFFETLAARLDGVFTKH